VNEHYNWKQICKVLVISCIAAAGIYLFTLFWIYNQRVFNYDIGSVPLKKMTLEFFADKISYFKHRLFLCSVEITVIMSLLYIRKNIVQAHGIVKGRIMIALGLIVMVALILATGSRASIISGIALLTIWSLYKLPIRKVRYKIAFLLLACGIGLFALSQHPRMENFNYEQLFSIRKTNQIDNVRLNIWRTALDTSKDYSLYGLGAGQSFQYLQNKYIEQGLNRYHNFNSHNQYIEEWIELGIPGLIFFILAWLSLPYCTQKRAHKSAIMLVTLYALNMLTDCMFGRFDGIALWCVWMILIRLQSDAQSHQQTTGDTQ
jgi:O-antigen ligase